MSFGSASSLLDGLNTQQKRAVTCPFDRHTLVLAGAGCGKTAVLTRRIAHCASEFCAPYEILALTFARKAAQEMRERLGSMIDSDSDVPGPTVSTFHGWGLSLLKQTFEGTPNFVRLGYTQAPNLLSGEDRLSLLVKITNTGERQLLGGGILQLDKLVSKLQVNPKGLDDLESEARLVLEEIGERLEMEKRARGVWEFSDMIRGAAKILRKDAKLADNVRLRFKHILVDEFQDTNPLQIELLKLLLGQSTRVFAVGDDDQAIYGFRGADIGPTVEFASCFSQAQVIKLETNYRSTPRVLRTANRIFRDKTTNRKVLVSGRDDFVEPAKWPNPTKRRFRDQKAMVAWVAETSVADSRKYGIGCENMAMLFRTNESMATARELLKNCPKAGNMQLLTVHGSKGLEFPVVFLCDLEDGQFPNCRLTRPRPIRSWMGIAAALIHRFMHRTKEPKDLAEEKRLFYVGVTRAERVLYLLSVAQRKQRDRTIRMAPSRFLRLV